MQKDIKQKRIINKFNIKTKTRTIKVNKFQKVKGRELDPEKIPNNTFFLQLSLIKLLLLLVRRLLLLLLLTITATAATSITTIPITTTTILLLSLLLLL